MRKRKLLLVTGAGASIPFGFPSTNKLDSFLKWETRSRQRDLGYRCLLNKYNELRKVLMYNNSQTRFNYEKVLYLLEIMELRNTPDYPLILKKPFSKIYDDSFKGLRVYLIDKLLDYFRKLSLRWSSDQKLKSNFDIFKKMLSQLAEFYEISFITTNHDNILTNLFPNHNTGFDSDGKFQRELIYESTWNKGVYLHGSVHFDMKTVEKEGMHKIYWQNDLSTQFSQNANGRSHIITNEGNVILRSSIVEGLGKPYQIMREPFLQYYMLLDKLVYESDAILFIGYGFNDMHLNNVFSFIREDKSKIRKIVIIDYKNNNSPMEYESENWINQVCKTIPFNINSICNKKSNTPTSPQDLNKWNELEYSSDSNYPIAFWYGGLIPACNHFEKIIEHLK